MILYKEQKKQSVGLHKSDKTNTQNKKKINRKIIERRAQMITKSKRKIKQPSLI
jgi:hypothetical protein